MIQRAIKRCTAVLLLAGCASQGEPTPTTGDSVPNPTSRPPVRGPVAVEPTLRVVVPTDERPVVTAATPPAPISGGTLLVTRDGLQAVAADPDLDRVLIVDLTTRAVTHSVALEPGDEPGRVTEDDAGRVHVALRRGGAVATIELATGAVMDRRDVCGAPRGLTFDAVSQSLLVACADGALVTLPAQGEAARVELGVDARDVVVRGNRTFVSRFKSAELLEVASGAVTPLARAASPFVPFAEASGAVAIDSLAPNLAWRTIADGATGGMLMLHQGSRMGDIDIGHDDETESAAQQSSYGGGGDCSGVVQTELTPISATGEMLGSARVQAVLAVDVAVDSARQWVAVAQAGAADPAQPQRTLETTDGSGAVVGFAQGGVAGTGVAPAAQPLALAPGMGRFGFVNSSDVLLFFRGDLDAAANLPEGETTSCMFPALAMDITGQATAVAFLPNNQLLVQTREPATLSILNLNTNLVETEIALGGQSTFDTGHEMFHRDTGAGIACASCHGEGGEDGHVWRFAGVGPRRTQALHVGLEGTAPFHWEGDMLDIGTLMEEVLVGRMGGVHESPERTVALERWLYTIEAPAAVRAPDDEAALRGRAIFEGAAQCSTCHAGAKLTNNETVDVGTGERLQVPSLVAIAYRAPFVHTGCATTLHDRFDPECGGTLHGKVDQLSAAELDDLVAYLESL